MIIIIIIIIDLDNTEDPLIHIVRTQQGDTKSTMLQTARRLQTELQRGTKRITSKQGRKRKKA